MTVIRELQERVSVRSARTLRAQPQPVVLRIGLRQYSEAHGERRSFTLVELLVVVAVLAALSGLLLPVLGKGKVKVRDLGCLHNLKQWGTALHLYVSENEDYLPEEGAPTPQPGPLRVGWYVALPRVLDVPPYQEMPWRTNASIDPGRNLFICPSNQRRATNNNLFHYCLNTHVDGTGENDHPVKLSSLQRPAQVVYLFDNGKRAAVAQQNNVHTNLHGAGAQFLFVDGHAGRFKNTAYWDFQTDRGRTNNPDLVWAP